MKKAIVLLLLLALFVSVFTGCSGGSNSSSGKREINAPSDSSETDENNEPDAETAETESGEPDESSDTSDLPEGTIASLDELRQRVTDAGYEISELEDLQRDAITSLMGDILVDGFNIVIGSSHNPILELVTPDDAQIYADMTNEGGYAVAIVNGRFVTSVEAAKGIIEDDALQAELETIMDAKAQVQEGWTDTEAVSSSTSDYKGAFALMDTISKSMNTLLEQSITKNNKAHPAGDPLSTDGVFPLQFNSIAMGLTSMFCEDDAQLQAVVQVTEMLGMTESKVTRNAAHDYTLTAKRTRDNAAYEIHATYDPTVGSMRMVEKTNGEVTEFFEFVPLGMDQYAFQNNKERGVVTYKDNKLISYHYTKLDYQQDDYNSESDSIYPSGNGANAEWVAPLGEGGYAEYYNLDKGTFKLNVDTFGGGRVNVEIPAE